MKIKILFIFIVFLSACSPNSIHETPTPSPSSTVASPTREKTLATMTPTEPKLESTATPTQQDLLPGATPTLSVVMLTEIASADDPVIKGIMASFSTGPHAANMLCDRCHPSDAGSFTRKLAWLDDDSRQVVSIFEPKQICLKCHNYLSMDSPVMLEHPGFECTYCHDSHHPQPTCAQSACH